MKELESAMKTFARLFAAALCVISFGLTQALAATSATGGSKNVPSGLSFSYDAQHDQISASGIHALTMSTPTLPPITGTITVTLNIHLVTHFRHHTAIHCSLAAAGGQIDQVNLGINGGIETASDVAKMSSNGWATCTLTIPYSWTLPPDPEAVSGLVLAFGAHARQHEDMEDPTIERSTFQIEGVGPLPANGATTTATFDVAL
jgi:hypothetical protein